MLKSRVCSHERRNEVKPAWDFISVENLTSVFSQLFTCVRMNWGEMNLKTVWMFQTQTRWMLHLICMGVWNSMRVYISYRSFWQKWISFQVIKYPVNTTRNEMPTHVHENIRSFWNSVKTKFHVNRTCFHAGLWNLKTVWVHFASRVNALLVIYPKCDISSLLAEVVSKHDRYKS